MLIVSGTSQAQVFSRDGEPGDNRGTQYMKGDPYIRDMKHTSSVPPTPTPHPLGPATPLFPFACRFPLLSQQQEGWFACMLTPPFELLLTMGIRRRPEGTSPSSTAAAGTQRTGQSSSPAPTIRPSGEHPRHRQLISSRPRADAGSLASPRPLTTPLVSLRIWDVEQKRKQKTVVVVKSKERGTRTRVTTCAFAPDGKNFAAGQLRQRVAAGRQAGEES